VVQVEGKKVGTASMAREALSRAFGEYLNQYIADHRAALAG
jgi:hypothetical protein